MKTILVLAAIVVVAIVAIYYYSQISVQEVTKDDSLTSCTSSGGTVTTRMCCGSASDFPNTCLIGACGCSPSNSHEVKVCNCGEGKCWDSEKIACV